MDTTDRVLGLRGFYHECPSNGNYVGAEMSDIDFWSAGKAVAKKQVLINIGGWWGVFTGEEMLAVFPKRDEGTRWIATEHPLANHLKLREIIQLKE